MQNSKELQRRQSLPHQYGVDTLDQEPDHRPSLMGFASNNVPLNGFQYSSHSPESQWKAVYGWSGYVSEVMGICLGEWAWEIRQSTYAGPLLPNQLSIDTSGLL